jgi:uncharacterized protein (TIGR00369 family)
MPMDDALNEAPYPFARHIGMQMTDWRDGYARVELPVAAFLLNRHGNLHGGVHASLLDTAMGYAGCWTGDPEAPQLCLTLSLNVMYLSRPRGSLLIAEGRKTGGGRRSFFAEGTLVDDAGETVASGSGVFRYRARDVPAGP